MDTNFQLLPPSRTNLGEQHARFDAACRDIDAPVAVLDVHALSANAHMMVARAGGKPIRIASKSIRSRAVLKAVLATNGFRGVLAFSLAEAIMLVQTGVTDDVVVAYPTTSINALTTLLNSPYLLACITVMIDHPDQLRLLEQHAQPAGPVRVCLDLDMSTRIGPIHVGTRRSPIHTSAQAAEAAERITAASRLSLVGVMGYEAQIAGVPDDHRAMTALKRCSQRELRARRQHMVAAIEAVLARRGMPALAFVNGGGTGSLESTAADPSVTELGAGSGLYGPHLFDRYTTFSPHPAAFFGLDVVRKPATNMATVYGGGWIASGVPSTDRLPAPVYPPGLSLTATEGAGEVQTPLKTSTHQLHIGQRVWFRHTKAAELAEHVNQFHIIDTNQVMAAATTYRGEGLALV